MNVRVIAGNDGNYYRPDGQDGWHQMPKPTTSGNTLGAGRSGTRRSIGWGQSLGGQSQWSKVQASAANQQRLQSWKNEFNALQLGALNGNCFIFVVPLFLFLFRIPSLRQSPTPTR